MVTFAGFEVIRSAEHADLLPGAGRADLAFLAMKKGRQGALRFGSSQQERCTEYVLVGAGLAELHGSCGL